MDIRHPQPIAPKATLGSIVGYGKKEQVEVLRTYLPRISLKRMHQNVNEGEEDGSWNEDSSAKRMCRLAPTLCCCIFVFVVVIYMKCIYLRVSTISFQC